MMSTDGNAKKVLVKLENEPMREVEFGSYADAFKAYEDGKHRRYELLFAVSGAAFTIAKIFPDPNSIGFLGSLKLWHVSVGMFLFTLLMTFDIFMFGEKFSNRYKEMFGPAGKAVLLLIGVLIAAAWVIVGYGDFYDTAAVGVEPQQSG